MNSLSESPQAPQVPKHRVLHITFLEVMSPKPLGPIDVLRDDNYFLWEFNARMTLARKDLLNHIVLKSEEAERRSTVAWEAAGLKALAVLVKLLGPTYQSMVRESSSAIQAWETLRGVFVKQTCTTVCSYASSSTSLR
ncbi:unnamed protein product [Phytophthora fragariaefolia]|uniref:Unnamed protein product n=1 Tax=Phytophthora fragariaefolia TaxID=1490495 RepID=A0A9W7CS11_9STRA|nr:unnamed protein product [Phytophthora fragariaefolia]